ncbi:hypothetical protein Tco_0445153 [Tanacetum coccineum]
MAALTYKDDHNKVAYLEKSKGSEEYHQILDFLNGSTLRYALTHCPPIVYDSLVRQFWASATVRSLEDRSQEIVATIDGNEVIVTESSIRTQLRLDDGGVYMTSPSKRFLRVWLSLVTQLMAPSPSSRINFLLNGDTWIYNFSKMILDGMIGNVGATKHKFLMYPRFIQMILGIQTTDPTPKAIGVFSSKLFANMKLKFEGDHMPLLAAMLPRENVGAGAAVAAGGSPSSPPLPLVTPQASPRAAEVDPTPSIPSPPPSLRPRPTRQSGITTPVEQSSPLRQPSPVRQPTPSPVRQPTPSPVRQRTPSPARQPSPSPVRQPSPIVVHSTQTNPSPFMEDDNAGGDFYVSPNRSNEAPPTPGQPAGGAEEPDALTTLSSKLDRCMDNIGALETELNETKKTLGGAVLTLIGRVKHLEVQLKKSKRKVVLSNSEEEGAPFDIEALQVLANVTLGSASIAEVEAAISLRLRKLSDAPAFDKFKANISAVGTNIPAGSEDIPAVSTSVHAVSSDNPAGFSVSADSISSIPTAAPSNKGKEPMMGDLSSEQARIKREVDDASLFYTKTDWINIIAQAATNTSLAQQLLGADVIEENFSKRMVDLMRRTRQAIAERITKENREGPMTQLKEEFGKIQQALEHDKILDFNRTLPRSKPALKEPSSKKLQPNDDDIVADSATSQTSKVATQYPADLAAGQATQDASLHVSVAETVSASIASTTGVAFIPADTNTTTHPAVTTDSTTTTIPTDPNPTNPAGATTHDADVDPTDETQNASTPADPTISSPSSTGTPKRRKRTARKRAPKPFLDMDDQSLIKFDSGSESEGELVTWAALAAWEVLSTPLGEINAMYRVDGVAKHFTTLREILHMVDRQDLMKLYGIVTKFYESHIATGVGLLLWGDLKVLIDSLEGGEGYSIWGSQQNWQVRSWRLYTFSNVHVLETMTGKVLYMFVDVPYPLSVKLMERMFKHKLELARDVVGNDLTTAEQLIRFIKGKLAATQGSAAN